MSDDYVSTEHLLVGLATDGGQAATVLRDAGADAETADSTRSSRSAATRG